MRPTISYVSTHLEGDLVGAEVGVFRGENAYDILSNLPQVKKLYLVDPYTPFWVYTKSWLNYLPGAKELAIQKLEPIDPERYTWIYEPFEAELIPEPLDFIYIDGCHSYEAVKHDILEAEKIVKIGGVIGGHDYYLKGVYDERFGVGRAVREHYETLQHSGTDWWAIKVS